MRSDKYPELSDCVYVDRTGKFRFTWDIAGEIEGVFDYDDNLDFFTTYSDGDKY